MKAIRLFQILAMILFVTNIYGQTEFPDKKAKKGTQDYSKLLVLSKAQEDSIYKMLLEIYTYQNEAKKASDKAKELSQNKDNKLQQILTLEQYNKYQAYLKHISDSIENSKLPPWKRK